MKGFTGLRLDQPDSCGDDGFSRSPIRPRPLTRDGKGPNFDRTLPAVPNSWAR